MEITGLGDVFEVSTSESKIEMTIVICGCSYSIGIGCENLFTQPYGALVANEFNCKLINLSRGGASNYAIYLQGIFAANLEPKPNLVIISQTSFDRIEWVIEGRDANASHSLLNLNYHQYPPFNAPPSNQHTAPLDFHIKNHPKYDPFILCEQVGGIDDYLKCLTQKSNTNINYYTRLRKEPVTKLELMRDRYVMCDSYEIKKNYDIGLLVQAYYYIKRKGINCLLLVNDVELFGRYIDDCDILEQNWGMLSAKFPDSMGTRHTSEVGHRDTADKVIKKIRQEKLM